jgi:hypothetical protein
MMDLSPIANTVKQGSPPPPQAQPSASEVLKAVPETEIQAPVPPLPAKGGEPGLGEHLDLYDTEAAQSPPPPTKEDKADKVLPDDKPTRDVQAEITRARVSKAEKEKADKLDREAEKQARLELLGKDTGLPMPTTDPIHQDLPFLKPLGQSIDTRV